MSSQEPTRRRRKPLGQALTAAQIFKAVGQPDPADAEAWWERRSPTYARRWLLSKPK